MQLSKVNYLFVHYLGIDFRKLYDITKGNTFLFLLKMLFLVLLERIYFSLCYTLLVFIIE